MALDSRLRSLPSADSVLRTPIVADLQSQFLRTAVVRLVRLTLDEYRAELRQGAAVPNIGAVAERVVDRARTAWIPSPRLVINATGVILQTNLGRSPLSSAALAAMSDISAYSDVEFDLKVGKRGSRQQHVRELLVAILGAESSHVAVNSAGAVFLALTAMARGKEVIVSRGQLVEIGGGFRVPVILRQSGAKIVEVGTTNRTRLADYEDAITHRTAAILHVHSSNFKIIGFTEQVDLSDLARLAHRYQVPLIDDNGSGALLDTARFGLAHEPMPEESLEAGSDLVAFSGDKLLGGPQAGILVGRSGLISQIARHPLARALRPDKSVLTALSTTLLAYLRGRAEVELPVWQMIALSHDQVQERATLWAEKARMFQLDVCVEDGESPVGGGSLPGETLPTSLLRLPGSITAVHLRAGRVPIVARTQGRRVLLDLRTVLPAQDQLLLDLVVEAKSGIDDPKTSVIHSGTS